MKPVKTSLPVVRNSFSGMSYDHMSCDIPENEFLTTRSEVLNGFNLSIFFNPVDRFRMSIADSLGSNDITAIIFYLMMILITCQLHLLHVLRLHVHE